jgi:PAS domain S-box-containing protein
MNIHVLIIDDQKPDRELVKNLLLSSKIQYTFFESDSWEKAKGILGSELIHVIFLDYYLPKHSGLDLLKKLTARFGNIPVIILTEKGAEDIAVNILKIGAYDYLTKEKLSTKALLHSLHNTIHLSNLKNEAKRSDQLLKIVTKGTSILSGKAFFKELIGLLSNFFKSEYSFIIELYDTNKFKQLAFDKNGTKNLSNSEYQRITDRFISHNHEFMEITDLKLRNYANFFGIMIRSRKLENIGFIGLLKNDPFKISDEELQVLNVLINRTAVEFEWIQNEAMLKSREEELRAIYEHSNDAVVTFVDNKIKFANKSFKKLLNKGKELDIKTVFSFLDRGDQELALSEFETISKGKKKHSSIEVKGMDSQDKRCFLDIDLSSYINNKKTTILMLIRDTTIRKQMEQEIIRSNKLDSISVLSGGIAHDFNNILTAILGNLTLAKLVVKKEDKIHKKISDAEHATFLAKDLTQQLLTFSKGGNPVKKTTSLVELVQDSIDFVLRGSSIIVKYDIDESIYKVDIDIGQINQVINNLIINAKQAMNEKGTIHIQIKNVLKNSLTPLAIENGKYVSVSFKDEGPGIPPNHIERIFDPFFTTKKNGSGLGLANCYTIIKKHGGVITVDSVIAKGTEFTIFLPSAKDQLTIEEKTENNLIKVEGKVLIIDDNQSIRDILSEILEYIGLKAEITNSFESAIELIFKNRINEIFFDFIIIDLTIPGSQNAIDTSKRIRELSPESKIVISSGYSNDINITNFKQSGFSGALIKPYRFEDVTQLFTSLVK